MNNIFFSVIIILLGSIIILLIVDFLSRNKKPKKEDNLLIMQRLAEINNTLDNKLSDSTKQMQRQFSESSKIIQNVTEKLTTLDKTNQQVIGFSAQLNNLSKILTNQKQRGNLGEAGLQLVLENILPPTAFTLQYQFKDGDKVDAVIKTKDGLIPIDAKFSLNNYERLINEEDKDIRAQLENDFKADLKNRIDETSKYIKTKEGTLEFAFMYIPNEPVYYDLMNNEVGSIKVNTRNLIEYAFNEKRVIIVSPTTFAAYLLTVLQGLRAFKIEESAKSIRKNVEALGRHIKSYEDFMHKVGTSLGTTVNHYNKAYGELGKMDKDVVKIAEIEPSIKVKEIEGPKIGTEQE